MTLGHLADDLRASIATPDRHRIMRVSFAVMVVPRVRALVLFRLGQFLYRHRMTPIATWLSARILRGCGADLSCGAEIGPGLILVHSAGIVIGDTVRAGSRLRLYQNVTLGDRGTDAKGQPRLGSNVTVYAGASILGPVTIGDDVVVAAGAVVLRDVPSQHLAVGVPAILKPMVR